MPAVLPVTIPVVIPTLATAGVLVCQIPPGVASVNVIVCPTHNEKVVPPIAAGNGLTVTTRVLIQEPSVHVIIAVPAPVPLTMPVDAPTVAIAVLLLVHVTPAVVVENVVVLPTQTVAVPVIAAGVVSTVILYIVKQPELVV